MKFLLYVTHVAVAEKTSISLALLIRATKIAKTEAHIATACSLEVRLLKLYRAVMGMAVKISPNIPVSN
jgi:hypothetical protein